MNTSKALGPALLGLVQIPFFISVFFGMKEFVNRAHLYVLFLHLNVLPGGKLSLT